MKHTKRADEILAELEQIQEHNESLKRIAFNYKTDSVKTAKLIKSIRANNEKIDKLNREYREIELKLNK